MNRDQIKAKVEEVFVESLGSSAFHHAQARPKLFWHHNDRDRRLHDLDSLDQVEFVMAIEDAFDIEIDDVSAAMLKTVDDFVLAVETRLSQPAHGDR
jgi:acyl carrier protein